MTGPPMDHENEEVRQSRVRQFGRLMEANDFPRVGIVGDAGREAEVSLDPTGAHIVLSMNSTQTVAAIGMSPAEAREHVKHVEEAVRRVEARHGRKE